MLDARCLILDARCSMLDTWCSMLDAWYLIFLEGVDKRIFHLPMWRCCFSCFAYMVWLCLSVQYVMMKWCECMHLLMKLCKCLCRKLPSFAGRWTSRRWVYVALTRPYLCRGRSPWSWCASGTISVFRALTGTCYGCQWASPSLRGTAAGIWRERSCLLGEWNLHLGEFDFLFV